MAAADAIRPDSRRREAWRRSTRSAAQPSSPAVVVRDTSRSEAFYPQARLRYGREYLSTEAIDAAFPGPDRGEPFDISHLATAPDGTLALAIYRFPAKKPVEAWRRAVARGRLLAAFQVPAGSFGGGSASQMKAGSSRRSSRTATVALFTRTGQAGEVLRYVLVTASARTSRGSLKKTSRPRRRATRSGRRRDRGTRRRHGGRGTPELTRPEVTPTLSTPRASLVDLALVVDQVGSTPPARATSTRRFEFELLRSR